MELAGGIIDAGDAGTLLGEDLLRLHGGLAVAAPLLAGRRRHLALLLLFDIGRRGHRDCRPAASDSFCASAADSTVISVIGVSSS